MTVVGASWETSTGAGDDVLEVTHDSPTGITVTRVTAADLRRIADAGELEERFGSAFGAVGLMLKLYRLAHEPALARALEDETRAALARNRELAEREHAWRQSGELG